MLPDTKLFPFIYLGNLEIEVIELLKTHCLISTNSLNPLDLIFSTITKNTRVIVLPPSWCIKVESMR